MKIENLNQIINNILIERKLTGTALAEELGISSSHLSLIRSGKITFPRKKSFWDALSRLSEPEKVDMVYRDMFKSHFSN